MFEGTEVSQTPLKFIKIVDGEYRLAEANENGAVADVETTTDDVKIMGLKSGKYTLKETGFASGYAKNFMPIFTVELAVNQETG